MTASKAAAAASGRNSLATFAAAILLFHAFAAEAQTIGRAPPDDISIWRIVGALILCLLFAVAGAMVLRARRDGVSSIAAFSRARRLTLIESIRLPHHSSVSIVACDGEEMLLSSSPDGAQLLRILPQRIEQQTASDTHA